MKALLLRDLRLSIRAGGGFGFGLAFFLILILLVAFGLGPNPALLSQAAAGLLWLGALLACRQDHMQAVSWQEVNDIQRFQ